MAHSNFWESSHCKEWLLNREYLELWRGGDVLRLGNVDDYHKVMLLFTNFIQCLGDEQLNLTQPVISTAIVYFRRFYSRHSLGDVDPFLLAATCIYLASKSEASLVVSPEYLLLKFELLIEQHYWFHYDEGYQYQPYNITQCEYILVDTDCNLIVFHPYDPLTQYVAHLGQKDILLPTAWKVVNNTYHSDICLLYPPYLIALAALHMAAVLHDVDVTELFAELSVNVAELIDITTSILDIYKLWNNYNESEEEAVHLLAKVPEPEYALEDYFSN